MRRVIRYLNGFILSGVVLLLISIAGLLFGDGVLAEPGQPANPLAWFWYLLAAVIMLVNGVVSIRTAPGQTAEPAPPKKNRDDEPRA